jgi:hypothetical protein
VTECGLLTKSTETKTLKLQTRFPPDIGYNTTPWMIFSSKCNGVYQATNKEKGKEELQVKRFHSLESHR